MVRISVGRFAVRHGHSRPNTEKRHPKTIIAAPSTDEESNNLHTTTISLAVDWYLIGFFVCPSIQILLRTNQTHTSHTLPSCLAWPIRHNKLRRMAARGLRVPLRLRAEQIVVLNVKRWEFLY